ERIWNDIEPFAEYAFNKSHSAAYGLLTMQTAYLKAHYPLEYMAAVLTSYTGKTDSIVKYVGECSRGGMNVLPPDVNSSGRDFTAIKEGIRFGLAGIRGVGEAVVDYIVAARADGGPFESLNDFCTRVDMRQMNKKTVEALIKAGAFDSTGYTRKHLMSMMDTAVDAGAKRQRDIEAGQGSLFDMFGAEGDSFAEEIPGPNDDEWEKKIRLAFEKEMLGIYVSDHPLRDIEANVRAAATYSLGERDELPDGSQGWFAGLVTKAETRPTKTGKMMGTFVLEDLDGSVETVLFPKVFEQYRDMIEDDAVLRVKARLEESDRGRKLIASEIMPFDGSGFERGPERIKVRADAEALRNGCFGRLKEILAHYPGRDFIELTVLDGERSRVFRLGGIDLQSTGLHAELTEMFGFDALGSA
ncbi:MAG: OB-fold nucleic acid binding domain-containing protein, partial [Coriobacteriia bacterium]|nr:OB-fold nucleic acid binding domain-containing protein [Coriobacteriia bacterium]